MNLSRFAVKRPVTITMIVLIILLLGAVSFSMIGIDLLPEMNMPVAVVITSYQGSGPEGIEELVTKPIEEAVASVENIDKVFSESSEGTSLVMAQFTWNTDMDHAALKMREKIGMIEGFLPEDCNDPLVMQFDPSMMPILIMTLSGPQGEAELKNIAEDFVKPRLERIEGVASVAITGGKEREVRVRLDLTKLEGYGLTQDMVSQSLAAQNLNSPGGTLEQGGYEYLLRTIGEFESVDEIKNIIIPLPAGGSVRLQDIAEIEDGFKETSQYNYMNSNPTVGIIVQKQSGANTVKVSNAVLEEVENLKKELAQGSDIIPVMNQAEYIERSINNVAKNAIVGAALATIMIFLFLKNIPSTLIIGIAIPISIIATFILVYFNGLTLNLMSLGGLALGVGLLIDNSIVVLENIFRHRSFTDDRFEASITGATEVMSAITASTLTTLAVFLPIVFVEGLASLLFKEFALTVSFSLLASLGVSLTLVPMLSSKFLRKVNFKALSEGKSAGIQQKVTNFYGKLLNVSLKNRIKVLIIGLASFVASFAILPLIGFEFIPAMDTGQFQVQVELPKGTELEETKSTIQEMEKIVQEYDELEYLYVSVGASSQDMMMGTEGQSHVGQLYATLKDLSEREKSTSEIVEELRQKFKDIPGADISIIEGDGMSMGSTDPISIQIKGDDFAVLKSLGEEVSSIVEKTPGTREVSFSMEEGRPEMLLRIKRDKASSYGLTSSQIAASVRSAISGRVATIYRSSGEEIDVRTEAMAKDKESLEDIRSLKISTPSSIQIPLEEVVEFEVGSGPTQISRDNQVRTATVSAKLSGRDLGSVMNDITEKLDEIPLPNGYFIEYGGEQKEMQEAFVSLALALILAILLMYMIMAAQFESLLHPFIIMFSVPLAIIGAIFGLFITGRTFNVPAFIGLIMLAGVVTNNAIVMVDYINQLRKKGMPQKEAIVEAGKVRLRPILMTASTTILAMLPMVLGIGEGSEVQAPLATVVVGGLTASTLLTLVVVPVVYSLLDDLKNFFTRKLRRIEEKQNVEA